MGELCARRRRGLARLRRPSEAFLYRKIVTVNSSQIAGATPHLNFPVLVSVVDPDLRTTVNGGRVEDANGYDIIFRLLDGTDLDFEIEQYVATSGALVAWVRVPVLRATSDTQLAMLYGDPTIATSQENITAVWDANYRGVWHLSETSTGALGEFLDSTSHNNDGQGGSGNGTRLPNRLAAKIGDGQNFDGDLTDDHILIPDSAAIRDVSEGDYTVEGWLSPDVIPAQPPPLSPPTSSSDCSPRLSSPGGTSVSATRSSKLSLATPRRERSPSSCPSITCSAIRL